eukprot:TRINITY_DN1058_c0_g12_i1.p1 TRINITY_DN1058_c0_g12~~TRINITY_DN1058_c0_g12_i1.p1  ORF type:complete len:312 (+),score=96.37 TRINITY_DN1058_c0_g12_i1:59-994(+)
MDGKPKIPILLTNDDGIKAEGLLAMARCLLKTGRYDPRVVCPSTQQSGVSQSITIWAPLYATEYELPGELKSVPAFMVDGTPADCVKLALTAVYKGWRPTLVFSGINQGLNTGLSLLYSGTVAGATEGTINNIPSVAASLDFSPKFPVIHYDTAAELLVPIMDNIVGLLEKEVEEGKGKEGGERERERKGTVFDSKVIFNINIPNLEKSQIKGNKLTRQGQTGWNEWHEEVFEEVKSEGEGEGEIFMNEVGKKKRKFKLRGKMKLIDEDEDVDLVAVKNGWVSITPLGLYRVTLEHQKVVEEIRGWKFCGE